MILANFATKPLTSEMPQHWKAPLFGKTLHSHTASLHPGQGVNLGRATRPPILGGEEILPSRFILQKQKEKKQKQKATRSGDKRRPDGELGSNVLTQAVYRASKRCTREKTLAS